MVAFGAPDPAPSREPQSPRAKMCFVSVPAILMVSQDAPLWVFTLVGGSSPPRRASLVLAGIGCGGWYVGMLGTGAVGCGGTYGAGIGA